MEEEQTPGRADILYGIWGVLLLISYMPQHNMEGGVAEHGHELEDMEVAFS